MSSNESRQVAVADAIKTMRRRYKFKTSEYESQGSIPIIDQSRSFIAGYTDDEEKAYDGPLPVIIFGDHTCVYKFVDFRFAVGADGTQLIRPKDEEEFDIRYLYFALRNVPLEQFGYQRHFKFLKASKILWRPMDEQIEIASVLSSYEDLIMVNLRRNDKLAELRDLLAPALLSGDVKASELKNDRSNVA
ncbi:MAG: restriction endonuclease subunit S [Pseudomonadota bacterium]